MPLSVVFLAAVYYIKVAEFRKWVDERTPIAKNLLGRWVQESGTKVIVLKGEQDPTFMKPKPPRDATVVKPLITPAPIAKAPEPVAPPVAPVESNTPPPPVAPAIDWQKLAANPSKWPKKVALTKPVKFPAVLNGRVVGSLVAPIGAEANLRQITGEKLGVEFNGGGALISADESDFLQRLGAN
jgi:hypothetical protein